LHTESIGTMRITLITAVLNRQDFVRRALESARLQDYPALQHVVLDGGSTDGTLDVIKAFPHTEWSSESDKNVYDAWNKGLARAQGDVIGILNSDDVLLPGALREIARLAGENPSHEMLVGGVEVQRLYPGEATVTHAITAHDILDLRPSNIIGGIPYTNARFLRRAAYQRIGSYDTRFKVCSDSDFLMRCHLGGVRAATGKQPIYRFCAHPGSLTLSNSEQAPLKLARQVHAMVATRLAETSDRAERLAYLRWHNWITPYLAALTAAHGAPIEGVRLLRSAFKADPLFVLTTIPLAVRHLIERRQRHGVAADTADGGRMSSAGKDPTPRS
jgi:glycosyltransferase involved in cell wall biosynthesis